MPIATNPNTGAVMFLAEDGQWAPARTAVNPETREMLAFDGLAWKPVPASKGIFDHIDDAVRSVASGITFGWADEFAAKMDELTGRGGTYEQNVQRERARDADIPISIKLPGEIAGAVGATVLTAPAAAFRAIAATSAKIPQWMMYGGLGAVEGALAGAGNATEGNRASGAATGVAIGAPTGAVAPSVVRGVQSVVGGLKSAVSPSAGAAADIGRATLRDATTPAELATRLTAAQADRPGATLADVGGENVKGLVERVAQTPGAGRTQVVPALTAKQEQQAARITDDLQTLTGTSKTAKQAIDDTIAARAEAARPLYDEAFQFDAATAPEVVKAFDKVTSTGYGKSILNSSTLRRTLQTEYGVDKISDAPLMVVIDAWKKAADDLTGAAIRKGASNEARVLSKMTDDVLSVVDKANPKYAEARNAWAGPSRFLDAIDNGRGILSAKSSAEEVAANFKRLSDAEKEAYRIGAVSSIIAKMGNDGARLADMTKYLRSPEAKAKIAAIMPDGEAAKAWGRKLQFEIDSSELTGRALGNSATARRMAERQDANGVVGDLVMDALMAGPTSMSFLRQVVTAGPRWLRDTLRSRTDSKLADLLTNPGSDLQGALAKAEKARRPQITIRRTAPASVTGATVNVAE